MQNSISIKGKLRTKVFQNDQLIADDESDNLVVDQGLLAMAKLMGGDDPAVGKPAAKVQVGTSATAPAAGDTTITAAFTKVISAVSYPTPKSVRFDSTIQTSEANGMTIQEYGLCNTDDVLYARIVKSPVVKNSSIRIVCEWTLTFS
jgi:hypothetical protein